jgi:hypothetical protein
MHRYDQNFPGHALERIGTFLDDPDVLQNPSKYPDLVREMKMEAILSTENSPYQEVRANVDPTDDPSIPSLTFRVWVIGIVFSGIGSFVDTLFLVRQPAISIGPNVAQMVACESAPNIYWAQLTYQTHAVGYLNGFYLLEDLLYSARPSHSIQANSPPKNTCSSP